MSEQVASELAKKGAVTEDVSSQFTDVKMATILSGNTNPRGIPHVAFIDSVESTLAATTDGTVETLIGAFNELHQKFKILEGHKAPDEDAKHEAEEDFMSHYSLSEMIYGRATITPTGNASASGSALNAMVEYPYDEALDILTLSLKNAKLRKDICDEDLDMLRDQIITVEVNMARVFNYDVKRRRDEKKPEAGAIEA
ncbi:VHL-binding protein [Aureococcus anophagefferens]|uniref:VHL-binding protein n=1 Tax=Aureococcus anophagefferens TaxID=44056 RepID=A0ABR1G8F1_AURAN